MQGHFTFYASKQTFQNRHIVALLKPYFKPLFNPYLAGNFPSTLPYENIKNFTQFIVTVRLVIDYQSHGSDDGSLPPVRPDGYQ